MSKLVASLDVCGGKILLRRMQESGLCCSREGHALDDRTRVELFNENDCLHGFAACVPVKFARNILKVPVSSGEKR